MFSHGLGFSLRRRRSCSLETWTVGRACILEYALVIYPLNGHPYLSVMALFFIVVHTFAVKRETGRMQRQRGGMVTYLDKRDVGGEAGDDAAGLGLPEPNPIHP